MIAGDANLCEVATFLKVGTMAIVLGMIEDDFIDKDLGIVGPVHAVRTVSHDPTLPATLELVDGGSCTAIELQWEFLRLAQKYADETGLEQCGGEASATDVLRRWEATLTAARARPDEPRRPARLGHEAVAARGVPRPGRARRGTTPSWRCSTSSTTTSARSVRCTSGWCGPGRSSASSTRRTVSEAMTEPPGADAGILPGHSAWRGGPTPWSPPTGTA